MFVWGFPQNQQHWSTTKNDSTVTNASLFVVPKRVCNLPKVTGRCKASLRRFWYNKATQRCQRFVFGGCGGNRNNFRTRRECNESCS
jgi:hypothetical protein